ncbi:hypothetical protein [Pimelobacter sp. 30-1]|uniref:hypothetical protein n=1 Tax=Pimelobacter sp. 30-1 TaxID=2004991 RepID=UPI001C03D0BC|nr:hypothetical protein [Pimelobacter sp. 30-1]
MKLMSRALVALALGATTLLLPPSAAQAAAAAPTAEPSIELRAVTSTGAPLENVRWNVFKKDPTTGQWDQGLQMGPLLTDANGAMSRTVAAGATYKVCFYDDDYDYNTRAVRYEDRCWNNATTLATATEWTPTTQEPTLQGTVTLPSAGSSLTVGHPWVDGSAKVGVPLTVRPGGWGPEGVALTYQWITHDGGVRTPIAGATSTTFTPTAAQSGKTLMVEVTGTLAGHRTATSNRLVGKVGGTTPTMTGSLAIQGTPMPGNTLTVAPGMSFTPADTDPMASWYVNGKQVGSTVDLANSNLVVTNAMAGAAVELRMIAYNWTCCDSQLYASAQTTIGGGVTTSPQPTVTGSAVVGSTLTAQAGTWAPSGVTLAHQWLRDGAVISGATAPSYQLVEADRGTKITVKVTGTLAGGYPPVARTSDPTATVQGVLAPGTPTITGQAVVGRTLTAQTGTWTPAPSFAYEWLAGGVKVDGATGASFVPTAAQAGKTITVKVTGSLSGYQSSSRTSVATAAVQPGTLTTATPTVSGEVAVGATLTADAGTWGPAGVTLAHQWLRDGAVIAGATSSTYVLTPADAGTTVTVKVTGTLPGYTTASETSAPAGAVPAPFAAAPTPTVTGRTIVGQTLTVVTGTWDPAPSFAYQWLRGGSPIAGATGTTYRLTAADAGQRITVRVTGTKAGYVTEDKTSAATAAVTGTFTTTPTPRVAGTAKVGKKLTAKPGTWAPTATLRYQWLRNGKVIKGATRATYKLAKADRGKRVSVRVTATRAGYTTVVKASAATKKVR